MKELLKKNLYFFIPYLLFLTVSVAFILLYSRPELHILTNKINSDFFDQFFKYATMFGDGIMIVILTLVLVFIRYRYAIAFLIGSLSTSVLVQFFKQVLLKDMYRPSKYFELHETYKLHLIEGVKLHSLHSFPSGHSATAFNVFLMLAIIVKNKHLKLFFLLIAVIVAYSRVYLSQHFIIDITVGSFVGSLFMLLIFWWVQHWNKDWLDKSLTDSLTSLK